MRGDVQAIFKKTPHDKQVLMFSATLSKETGVRGICKKFMQDVRPPACTLVAISAVLLPLRAAGGRLPSGHPPPSMTNHYTSSVFSLKISDEKCISPLHLRQRAGAVLADMLF
jgi:hypothetical protein